MTAANAVLRRQVFQLRDDIARLQADNAAIRNRLRARRAPPAPMPPPTLAAHLAQPAGTQAFYHSRSRIAAQLLVACDLDMSPDSARRFAQERARLILAPDPALGGAERAERILVLDSALATMLASGALGAAEYRELIIAPLLRAAPVDQLPVRWLPERPCGRRETSASPADPTRKIEVRYRLVELREPVASKLPGGAVNPAYAQALQPRTRERAASRLQIDAIARKLDAPALLRPAASWADGAPLVGPDGMTESGNGRLLALRAAAEINPEGYAHYKAELARTAAEFGLDPAQVRRLAQPLLVRERVTEMDEGARARFVAEANTSGAARMGVAEQAQADAHLIPDGFFAALQVADGDETLGDTLGRRANAPTVQQFLSLLPDTERAALLDERGLLSAEGEGRLERAMFARTLPGEAGKRLAGYLFEQSEALDRVGAGLRRALPKLGQAEDAIRAGQRNAVLAVGADLAVVVEKLRGIRKAGLSVPDYLAQAKLFPELTPFQERLLAELDRRRTSGRRVSELLAAYADGVMRAPETGQAMMWDVAPRKEDVLRAAIKTAES